MSNEEMPLNLLPEEDELQSPEEVDAVDRVRAQLLAGELDAGQSPTSELELGLGLKMQAEGARLFRSAWMMRGLILVLAIILVGEVLLIQARRILDPGQSQPGLSAQSSDEVSEYDVGPTPEDIATPSTIWVSDEDLPVEEIEEPAEEILPEPDDASEVLEPPDPAPLPTPP